MLHARGGRRAIIFMALATLAILAAPRAAVAASCAGNSHHVTLASGAASPGSGTTSTSFHFSVLYTDNAGCAPDVIEVAVSGVGSFSLTLAKGDAWSGATYARTMSLPAGTHAYSFTATSGSGAGLETVTLTAVSPGSVVVTSPTDPPPTPKPTPKPTPVPTPVPTTAPTAAPTTAPTSNPTAPSSPVPTGSSGPIPAASSSHGPQPTGTDGSPQGPGASTAEPTEQPARAGGPIGSPQPSAAAGAASPFGRGGPGVEFPRPLAALVVAMLGSLGGLALFAALSSRVLGWPAPARIALVPVARRRRPDGAQVGPNAKAAAARTSTAAAMTATAAAMTATVAPSAPSAQPDTRNAPQGRGRTASMQFAEPPQPGVERCRVQSRLVPLRSAPDDLQGVLLGRVDVGDEVDVLRQEGTSCYVRLPSGAQGWLPGQALVSATPRAVEGTHDD